MRHSRPGAAKYPATQALSTLPLRVPGLWEAIRHVYTDALGEIFVRAMYTENSSKRLIFPLPVSSDRQLGGLRSGEGIKGTTGPGRAQETAAVFPDTHTVVLWSGGSLAGSHRRQAPDHPRSE